MDRADEEFLGRVDGLFVGQLSPEELEQFDRLCRAGVARRAYEGMAGFMGLATVRCTRIFLLRTS